jgi:PAS domain S-box-containing protein
MWASPLRLLRRVLHPSRARTVDVQALWLSEQRFHVIWDAAADAMAISDANAVVLAANPAYYQLYGFSPEQVLGNSFAIIFPIEQREWAVAQYAAIFQSRAVIPVYESTVRRADGSERIVETRATFITTDDNRPALLSIIRDITARKRLEHERDQLLAREQAARIAAEAEAALHTRDQFLAVAAHELKTPLTTLRGYTDVLRRRTEREHTLNERDQRALHIIDAQARRLQELIDSLLDLRRLQAGALSVKRTPLDLCGLVRRLMDELQRHTLHVECPTDTVIVAGDEARLEQVAQNLLQNAMKYSPSGGLVTVRLRRDQDRALLTVSDQGVGIPEAAQARVFEQFYRADNVEGRQFQGMGIGLYVVKEIVTLHGGEIGVESREGQGSTFTVSLPLHIA